MAISMKSVFIREQKRYTLKELSRLFSFRDSKTKEILKKLKSYGVLKIILATKEERELSDLASSDDEISDIDADEETYFYIFTFVGVLIVSGLVLKCYPKYIRKDNQPIEKLKKVLKVIDKQNKKEQFIKFQNENFEETTFNLLATIMYFFNDYYEYGLYNTTQDVLEVNGMGEINWDKTINETFALISNNRPYYPELITKKRTNDEFDYFKRLHQSILTRCSKVLEQSGLLELFDFQSINLTDEEVSDFGDEDYVLSKILKEINVQFNTRKQLLLKTMYSYIANKSSLSENNSFSLFGTNSFHVIWERVCAEIFDNKLTKKLGAIDLPIKLNERYTPSNTLISIIEKPIWSIDKKGYKAGTLIPDLISIYKDTNDEYKFIIFDAKYYIINTDEKTIKGQPGIESITKQYLYQLAYKKFIEDHNFKKESIRNCFLLPTEEDEVIELGTASMEMLGNLGLEDIKVRLLPTEKVYNFYLRKRKYPIDELNL